MAKDGNKVSQILNQSLFHFSLKTKNVTLTIKIQTVIYIIAELAVIVLILKYIL